MFDLRIAHVALAAAGLAAVLCGAPALAEVAGLRLTTDRRLDTSSLRRIVEQLVKPGMTDQEKAIALWRFAADYNYFYPVPWEPPGEDNFATGTVTDPLKLINVYGYGYCFLHRSLMEALWEAAGLEARTGGLTGHVVAEVFYDGQYHCLDNSQKFYALLPDGRTIASRDQLADDPLDLVVNQKRPSDPFLPGAPRAILSYEDRHILAGLFFLRNFYLQHREYRTAHSMNLTLPAAARMVWHWQGLGKWRQKTAEGDYEMKNFGHFNPYDGPAERHGPRTYANAVYRFHPDVSRGSEELAEALVEAQNLGHVSGALTNARRGRAHGDLSVRLPYVICGWPTVLEPGGQPSGAVVVSGRAQCVAGGVVRLLLSTDEGATYTEVWRLDQPRYTDFAVDLSPRVDGRYAFRMRLAFSGPAGSARLEDLAVDVNTQAAQLPLPALLPGRNRITLDLGDGTKVMELNRQFASLGDLRRSAFEVTNVRVDGKQIHPPKGQAGEVTFAFEAPAGHDLVWLSVGGTMRTGRRPPPGESLQILLAAGRPADFKPVWRADIPPDMTHWCYEADEPVTLPAGTRTAYVKYRIQRVDEAAVAVPRIAVHYRRSTAEFPRDGLVVRYHWRENGEPRSHEQVVKEAPFTYTITVPKDAAVEMERVEVEAVRPGRDPIGEPHRLFAQTPALHRRDFRDPVIVSALHEDLARIRQKPDLDTFVDLFKASKHPLVRAQLASVVAYVGARIDPARAETALSEAAGDSDERVADNARRALRRLHTVLDDEAQVAALGHSKAERRALAAEVLGRRRVAQAREAIAALLGDRALSVRRAAALALARLRDERAAPALADLMEIVRPDETGRDPDALAGKLPFAVGLYALGDRRGIDVIEGALACPDRYTRYNLVTQLDEVAGARAERLFRRALKDDWAYVRRAAVVGLAHHGGKGGLAAVERAAKDDPVGWVRSEAAHAAQHIAERASAAGR